MSSPDAADVARRSEEMVAELRRLRASAELATSEEMGCDCARLRRTVAVLREADDRQRLTIAEQAATLGTLQAQTSASLVAHRAELDAAHRAAWAEAASARKAEKERDSALRKLEALRPLRGRAACSTCLRVRGYPSDPDAAAALRAIREAAEEEEVLP